MSTPIYNETYFQWYNASEKLRMRYPSEIVIGFLVNNLTKKGRVLDLGCGSGRHVILAAELGHEAFGVDICPEGFRFCRNIAQNQGLTVQLRSAPMDNTGYEACFFDAVICYSAINANTLEGQKFIIAEAIRILKPNGIFLVNFYGEKDGAALRCKDAGEKVAENTYVLPGKMFHENAAGEVPDYLLHISTPEEIKSLLSTFNEVRQFEIYLPYGNANLQEDVKASHLLFAIARK